MEELKGSELAIGVSFRSGYTGEAGSVLGCVAGAAHCMGAFQSQRLRRLMAGC